MNKEFYYDIVCPYAYMAFSYLKRFDSFNKAKIKLKPILLGGIFKLQNTALDPNQELSDVKREYLRQDILRQAQYFDLPLRFNSKHPISTVKAMRLIHACDERRREELSEYLYKAYWRENLDVSDDDFIKSTAQKFDLNEASSFYEDAKKSLYQATQEAFAKKVFGVPSFVVNQRLYFGADRMVFFKDHLGIDWPDADWNHNADPIDFYFDFSSPYSYLGWLEVKNAMALGIRFNFIPILLGAVFRELGQKNIPMLSAHPNKTEYYLQDMKDWAGFRGCPFKFNSNFPLRSVLALRLALQDLRAIDPIFNAAWVDDKDIADPEVMMEVLRSAGLSEHDLIRRAEAKENKEQLKKNTSLAISRGVFGVPTFFVKGERIFGQDRFSLMRKLIGK